MGIIKKNARSLDYSSFGFSPISWAPTSRIERERELSPLYLTRLAAVVL